VSRKSVHFETGTHQKEGERIMPWQVTELTPLVSEPMQLVYLSGRIDGLTLDVCGGWRKTAKNLLYPDVGVLNPLRGKELPPGPLNNGAIVGKFGCSDKEIVTRDILDIKRCDAMLLYLVDAGNLSVGTLVELGYAAALHKPIFTVIDDSVRNPFNNRWIRELSTMRFSDLNLAIKTIKFTFSTG